MLAGLIFGSIVMLGVCCWHFLRRHDVDLFLKAAKVALIVAVPVTLLQLVVGNRFGEAVTSAQSMKIAASEAQWDTCQPCGFSLIQFGGFTKQDPTPSFSITIPRLLSYMATGSFSGQVQGLNQLQEQEQRTYGRGNYMPNVRVIYWSMRVMAYAGMLMFLVAVVGGWLYRRRKLATARWFSWTAIGAIAFPYIAATAGWVLTEMGRQPWIVQGLLLTAKANSPSVSTTWIGISLGVFVTLYSALGIADFVLMRHYARRAATPEGEEAVEAMPAPSY
jgi:cytochrome bd ubiquinol oxidase subunit I